MRGSGSAPVAVPGSERRVPPGARDLGPVLPTATGHVSVFVRRRAPVDRAPTRLRLLERESFARRWGASEDDLARVREFATASGLEVRAESVARRTVELTGSLRTLEQAFGVRLRRFAHASGTFRGRVGPVHVPAGLAGVVEGVFGLDDRPQARPHVRRFRGPLAEAATVTPTALAAAYEFPAGTDGTGQCIGLVELGGGYRTADLATYFGGLGLAVPSVTDVSVDGAANAPTGSADGPDGEVALDLELAGALAPGARIAVYFAPNTDQGFLDALTTAVHDTANRPDVVSISWGGPEPSWTAQAMQALSSAAEDAASVGVTVTAASGDQGASDGEPTGTLAVDFPASSPFVLGCGGTKLELSAGAIASEVVWDDLATDGGATGGGVSAVFALPSYQSGAHVPSGPNGGTGRGVPDVAGDAAPETGFAIVVDGATVALGGTSAVAPMWAALVARWAQALGAPVGDVHAALYSAGAAGAFHDVTDGSNGGYSAGPGWDPCTGLGSPNGSGLLAALRALQSSG